MNLKELNEQLQKSLNEWEIGDETPDEEVPSYSAWNVKSKVLVELPNGERKELMLPVNILHAPLSNASYDSNVYGVESQYAVGGWEGDIEYELENVELGDDAYDIVPEGTTILSIDPQEGIDWEMD